jgi:hypothetical protein
MAPMMSTVPPRAVIYKHTLCKRIKLGWPQKRATIGSMFKRVLLCYDGSEAGRRALKRGAELAILVGAQVHVLSIIPIGVAVTAEDQS